jgi:hypothetical protein
MTYQKSKEAFISETISWFIMLHAFVDAVAEAVGGVSFVPIHRYGTGRAELAGKVCMVLGRERAGMYKNAYNFFGGKCEGTSKSTWAAMSIEEKARCILSTLFDETAEEMGIILEAEKFIKSCVCVTRHGPSVLFWCHIVGVSRGAWSSIMTDPKRASAWKYQEMDAIEHVPVDLSCGPINISDYVMQLIHKAIVVASVLDRHPACQFSSFAITTGLI